MRPGGGEERSRSNVARGRQVVGPKGRGQGQEVGQGQAMGPRE